MEKKTLVSIVGVDGAGKTTQAQHLVSRLKEKDIRAAYWKSPTFDWVRAMMNVAGNDQNGGDIYTDAVIFSGAHRMEQYLIRQMFEGEIHPRMLEDKGVIRTLDGQTLPADVVVGQRRIVDFYSFLMTEGMSEKEITDLLRPNEMWDGHFYKPGKFIGPDLIVHLNCAPEIAMSRIPREDKWEEVPFLKRLVKTYEKLYADPPKVLRGSKVIRIDAEPDIKTVNKNIDEGVLPYLRESLLPVA
jgi:thymidylate kinase